MSKVSDFFDVILKGESKTYNDHNWYTGSGLKGFIEGRSTNPYPLLTKPLSEYTIGEVKSFQSRPRDNQGQLWATGRYQIIPKTLIGVQNRLGLPDSQKYDQATQDAMGLDLLNERKAIKEYISGAVPDSTEALEKAALQVAMIWSSVGVPFSTQGRHGTVSKDQSYYSGGGDTASVPSQNVQEALKSLRANFGNLNKETTKSASGKKKGKGLFIVGSILGLGILSFAIYKIVKMRKK
jgi:hypothetical protein